MVTLSEHFSNAWTRDREHQLANVYHARRRAVERDWRRTQVGRWRHGLFAGASSEVCASCVLCMC